MVGVISRRTTQLAFNQINLRPVRLSHNPAYKKPYRVLRRISTQQVREAARFVFMRHVLKTHFT